MPEQTRTAAGDVEYALMVEWPDGDVEYVAAENAEHAERMAATIYRGRKAWTVGRKVPAWQYVSRSTGKLTGQVCRVSA